MLKILYVLISTHSSKQKTFKKQKIVFWFDFLNFIIWGKLSNRRVDNDMDEIIRKAFYIRTKMVVIRFQKIIFWLFFTKFCIFHLLVLGTFF